MLNKMPGYYRLLIRNEYHAALCRLRRKITTDKNKQAELAHKQTWYKGMMSEIEWWAEWLNTDEGKIWSKSVENPQRPIEDYLITDRLSKMPENSVSIIDIGPGPITHIGYTYPGKKIDITAVDPLARGYNKMLDHQNIIPPIKTIYGCGETLVKDFGINNFDFAYASNSLDHSYDPILVIQNMISIVKKNGYVLLRHYKNEAVSAEYDGLHQWNFDIKNDSLIMWNNVNEFNLTKQFSSQAKIDCYHDLSTSFGTFDHTDWTICILRKL